MLDSGTATAGQYDPAQAATNAKKFAADPKVVALVGPQMSGEGKAMTPILSAANLATVTPSSTNPDITNPKFAGQYKPGGKAIYFRTVTTDAYQGPNMANYMRDTLKVKSVYILDDSGAYGVGMSNLYEAQAKKIGMNVMGHDQLDPKEADYTTIITKIKGLNPDAVYYGGVAQAGVKVAKQLHDIFPSVLKAGGDGMVDGGLLSGVGFPAIEGWYCTQASPHVMDDSDMTQWVAKYTKAINGVSLGAMYALLALGFTMVYGIIELINFAHFNIFMVGSFFAMWVLKLTGLVGQRVILTGLPLVGVLLLALIGVMLFCGILGVAIERTMLRPMRNLPGTAAMITTIGVSYILFNVIL